MFHIHCKLPNASTEINGVAFELVEAGEGPDPVNHVRTVEPVSAEVAAQFEGIPGYEINDASKADAGAGAPARRGPGRPSKEELAARAAAQAAAGATATSSDPAANAEAAAEGDAAEGAAPPAPENDPAA